MKEYSFNIEKTTRYYTLGELDHSDKILFVLHGYGQLPQFFIRKFQSLVDKGYFVVAPEGPHRFYLEGTSGRVGASWMTKEARLDDIEDNLMYLKKLVESFVKIKEFKKISLLGFSQGGATATRFYEKHHTYFDLCVLWASVFPNDVPFQNLSNYSGFHFVVGMEDPYFTKESIDEYISLYQSYGIKTHTFQGKHNINDELLNQLF